MFYHINEKSALLMSIFREKFCNKEQIKKKIKASFRWEELGISFGNDRLDRRHTTFYFQWFAFQNPVLHTSYIPQGQNICTMYNIENPLFFETVSKYEVLNFVRFEMKLTQNWNRLGKEDQT